MKKIIKIVAVIILLLAIAAAIAWFGFLKPEPPPISPEDRTQLKMMPLPAELEFKNGFYTIEEGLGVELSGVTTSRLERAIERFYLKLEQITGKTLLKSGDPKLMLYCKKEMGQYPTLSDDESYSLTVNKSKIVLSAYQENGILNGLESLLQIIENRNEQWIIPSVEINDKPRFPWRGLMIDVSRHWIPKDVIFRNIDAMASVKMNVLHLHLTDYQGFRVESKVYPRLHEMGSQNNYYSQEDMKEVINYASDRGIRVIPEFDIPGHSTSWLVGYPHLASAPGPYNLDTTFGVLSPVMDPTRDEVYNFLDSLIGEMSTLFPDSYFHIGGDEVLPLQWKENSDIQEFMRVNEIADYHELQAYFNQRIQRIVKKHNKIMMGWDEILHPDLVEEDIVVQSWRNQTSLWKAARTGHRAILSAGYYLDHKQSSEFHYNVDPLVIPGAITIEIDSSHWKGWDLIMSIRDMEFEGSLYLFGDGVAQNGIVNFMEGSTGFSEIKTEDNNIEFSIESSMGEIDYNLEVKGDSIMGEAKISLFKLLVRGIRSGGSEMESGKPLPKFDKIEPLTTERESNILGGEACMWSEMVDARTVESRIWPRVATIAEKLWSPKILTSDIEDMYRRIMVTDLSLQNSGLNHQMNKAILNEIVDEPYNQPLATLVSVLQEDVLFNRMQIYDPELYTTTPLNRIVDAARPESYLAYRFNKDVNGWIQNKDLAAKTRITRALDSWSGNYKSLKVAFKEIERLKEVEPHSIHLSALSELGAIAMEDPGKLKQRKAEIEELIEDGVKGYGGTVLAVMDGFEKLLRTIE